MSQVVVVGDGQPFIAAMITLDAEALPGWLSAHGHPAMSVSQAKETAHVRAALDQAIERANKAVSRAESIRKYVVLDTDFTVDNGYLTPSLKVKRTEVLRDYSREVDSLYADVKRVD